MPFFFAFHLISDFATLAHMNTIIAPSILAADFARLGEEANAVLVAGADWLHIDVMDNHFVPNLTMGPQVVAALRRYGISAPIDVHLMISPVAEMIAPFAKAGADIITFHVDAVDDIQATIDLIRTHGCQAGLVFNPTVPLGNLTQFLPSIDMILIMSVNAGFGGQSFMPEVLEKVRGARQYIDDSAYDVRLEIDGGINADTIADATAAGADTFVAGSAIFGANDYQQQIQQLRRAAQRD